MSRTYYPRARAVLVVLLEDFDGGEGSSTHKIDTIPRSVSVKNNTALQADTFELELDYKDFPLDPRTVRSVKVAIFMADIQDPTTEGRILSRGSRKFIGYVDEPQTRLEEAGEVVRFTGRDYTGIFLDSTWKAGTRIEITRPLGLVLGRVVAEVPGAEGINIEFSEKAAEARFLVLSTLINRTKWSPKGKKDSAWQVIVDLVGLIGLIAVIELDTLKIVAPGEFVDLQPVFLYGQNVTRLTFKRKMNETHTKQIRIVAWDDAANERRETTYPTEPVVLSKKIAPSGKVTTDTAPVLTFNVSGAYTVQELKSMAARIYDQAAREQIEGELETGEMEDLENSIKLTRLSNGDAITVQLSNQDRSSIAGLSISESVEVLTSGINPLRRSVAEALATSFHRARRLATTFYVKTATHTWSREEGYKLSVVFINFVGGSA